MDGSRALQVMREPGFSTRDEADLAAGRGVGMAVVRTMTRISIGVRQGCRSSICDRRCACDEGFLKCVLGRRSGPQKSVCVDGDDLDTRRRQENHCGRARARDSVRKLSS